MGMEEDEEDWSTQGSELEIHGAFNGCSRKRNTSESDQTGNSFLLRNRFVEKQKNSCVF